MNAARTLPDKLHPTSGLFAKGKALVNFYKIGVKNVWANRKLSAQICKKYGATSGLSLSRSIVENSHIAQIEQNVRDAVPNAVRVSRHDLLTVLRTERDFFKLPMFCVVFAVLFEMTPIALWAFPRIAPSTCYSAATREKRKASYKTLLTALYESHASADGAESVHRLSPKSLRELARVLDFAWPYAYAPAGLLRSRMSRHVTEVKADDIILRNNYAHLDDIIEEEVSRALMARALPLESGLEALKMWLDRFKEPMDAGFFVVPYASKMKSA